MTPISNIPCPKKQIVTKFGGGSSLVLIPSDTSNTDIFDSDDQLPARDVIFYVVTLFFIFLVLIFCLSLSEESVKKAMV